MYQFRLFNNSFHAVLVTYGPNGPILLQTRVAALGHLADPEELSFVSNWFGAHVTCPAISPCNRCFLLSSAGAPKLFSQPIEHRVKRIG